AKLFETMAVNESYHAKIWFSLLNNGLGTTKENLTNSAQGENDEWADMYPEFAKTAREEGLEDIAIMFEKVAAIEKEHERRFLKALIALKSNAPIEEQVTKTTKKIGYVCMFCGATFEDRPDVCSVCGAIGSFDKKVIG
ncbi:MAG: rubrerythrin family protein, partial [Anaerotignaceae bacterium]